jgi:hypothetical protein
VGRSRYRPTRDVSGALAPTTLLSLLPGSPVPLHRWVACGYAPDKFGDSTIAHRRLSRYQVREPLSNRAYRRPTYHPTLTRTTGASGGNAPYSPACPPGAATPGFPDAGSSGTHTPTTTSCERTLKGCRHRWHLGWLDVPVEVTRDVQTLVPELPGDHLQRYALSQHLASESVA